MKITDEMVAVFQAATRNELSEEQVRAGLGEVLRVIDPVPDGVTEVFDRFGDRYVRSPIDRNLWRLMDAVYVRDGGPAIDRSIQRINARYGPVTWRQPVAEVAG